MQWFAMAVVLLLMTVIANSNLADWLKQRSGNRARNRPAKSTQSNRDDRPNNDRKTEITAKQRSFQYQIWLMLIIVFGVILAGFLMVPKTEEQRSGHDGAPRHYQPGRYRQPDGRYEPITGICPQGEAPKWKVVVAGGEGCNQGCQDVLVNSRQIHMLLGKSSCAVSNVFYLTDQLC